MLSNYGVDLKIHVMNVVLLVFSERGLPFDNPSQVQSWLSSQMPAPPLSGEDPANANQVHHSCLYLPTIQVSVYILDVSLSFVVQDMQSFVSKCDDLKFTQGYTAENYFSCRQWVPYLPAR